MALKLCSIWMALWFCYMAVFVVVVVYCPAVNPVMLFLSLLSPLLGRQSWFLLFSSVYCIFSVHVTVCLLFAAVWLLHFLNLFISILRSKTTTLLDSQHLIFYGSYPIWYQCFLTYLNRSLNNEPAFAGSLFKLLLKYVGKHWYQIILQKKKKTVLIFWGRRFHKIL